MTQPRQPAVFLDRDGVLNRTFVHDGVTHPPARLDDFELLPYVPEALERLRDAGFALVVVTNQPDVARGATTRDAVEEMNDRVRATLPVLDVLACYHDTVDDCLCRKPRPGMLLTAAKRWRLDLLESFMVGDRWSDVVAGQAAGCRSLLVETPHSGSAKCRPDGRVTNVAEAADWIIQFTRGGGA